MSDSPSDDRIPEPNDASPAESGPPEPAPNAPADTGAAPTPAERLREALQPRSSQEEDEAEELLWEGTFSSRAMIGKWILAGFVTVALLVALLAFEWRTNGNLWLGWLIVCSLLWAWFALQLAYRRLTCKYRLTTQRFIHESGLLKRITDRIEVIDIDDVSVEQRIVERMLGVGTIKISSSDRTHPELSLRGIEKVKEVAGLIDDTRRKERRRRGVHIEAI